MTTEWYLFVKVLTGMGIYFLNLYLRLGEIFFDFLMVGSAKFVPSNTFLFGATPRHK